MLLTVEEFAKALSCSKGTILQRIKVGAVPRKYVYCTGKFGAKGNRYRIDEAALEEFRAPEAPDRRPRNTPERQHESAMKFLESKGLI